jgi:DNA-binding response OmpR family regulator
MGHTVRVVASAEEADMRMASERFHLALLDVGLPGMDGVDFLSWILREDPQIAVIMVTGRDDAETALATLRAGARTYLVKPVPHELLRITVDDALCVRELLVGGTGPSI